ncbi:MAG: hypothetical protein RL095_4198 [Verrucomicrobiota bacterium]|jgi:type II secretory pathway pseudopilin PulG
MKSARFTLIELLTVVCVIGILSSMLLPALGRSRLRAQEAICINNLKQIGLWTMLYGDDCEGYLPLTISNTDAAPVSWDDLLSNYDGRRLTWTQKTAAAAPSKEKTYICPMDRRSGVTRTYAINMQVAGAGAGTGWGSLTFSVMSLDSMQNPSGNPIYTERYYNDAGTYQNLLGDYPRAGQFNSWGTPNDGPNNLTIKYGPNGATNAAVNPVSHHYKNLYLPWLMADGHSEMLAKTAFTTYVAQ